MVVNRNLANTLRIPAHRSHLPSILPEHPRRPRSRHSTPNPQPQSSPPQRPHAPRNPPTKRQRLQDSNNLLTAPDRIVELLHKRDLSLLPLIPEIRHMGASRVQGSAERDTGDAEERGGVFAREEREGCGCYEGES